MKWNRITRRHFLQGVGGAALTLPFLPSLLTKELLGSGGTPPKRFIALMSQNGAIQDYNLYPAALPMNSFSVPNGHNAHSDTLINILGAQSELSPVLGSFLNPYLSKMNIIRGLDWRFRIGHHYGANLGNVAGSVPVEGGNNINSFTPMATIDQLMAYSNAVYPTMSGIAERSMIINPLGSQGLSYSYQDPFNKTGDVSLLPTISNPRVLFNTLFSSIIAAQSEGSGPSDGSIFNAVYEDFQRLWNNSRLGSEDRQRLDSHMNFLSETESKVNQVNGSCSVPATPPDINHIYTADLATVEASYQAFNDVIAAAIRCDISRLATIHISKVLDIPGSNSPGGWHFISHNANETDQQAMISTINRWIFEKIVSDLVSKLDVTESGDSTYLDNSLVFYSNEHSSVHSSVTVPSITFGGAGGSLETGLYLDYRNRNANGFSVEDDGFPLEKPGVLYNRWLITMLQAMGMSPSDYERAGQLGYGDRMEDVRSYVANQRSGFYDGDLANIGLPLSELLSS